jgi:hypothetical protein
MSKLASQPLRAGCQGLLITLVAVAIVLPLGCLLIYIPLGVSQHIESGPASVVVMAAPAILFFLIIVGGGWGFLLWSIRRRAARLDAAFTPLGLTGERVMLTMRAYHGQFRGRQASVTFRRGPTLELFLDTPVQTRLSIDEPERMTTAIAGWAGRQPLSFSDPRLDGLRVFAADEHWARALLADLRTPALLRRLIEFEGPFVVRRVEFLPGSVALHLHFNKKWLGFEIEVEPDQARQWLDALAALAEIAESLPSPQVTSQASALEQNIHTRPTLIKNRTFILLMVAVAVLPICLGLAIALALILL